MSEVEWRSAERSRPLLIGVGVIIIALVASNIWIYMTLQTQVEDLQGQVSSLNSTYLNYMSSHSFTNSEYESLNSTYHDYIANHSHSDAEYEALQEERDAFKAPKLSLLSLQSSDESSPEGPYLHFYGEVWNVGYDGAYDCRIHVTAYQGDVKAIDSWIGLGTIPGENKKSVDVEIDYEGVPLTAWNVSEYWVDEHFH